MEAYRRALAATEHLLLGDLAFKGFRAEPPWAQVGLGLECLEQSSR